MWMDLWGNLENCPIMISLRSCTSSNNWMHIPPQSMAFTHKLGTLALPGKHGHNSITYLSYYVLLVGELCVLDGIVSLKHCNVSSNVITILIMLRKLQNFLFWKICQSSAKPPLHCFFLCCFFLRLARSSFSSIFHCFSFSYSSILLSWSTLDE